KAFGIIVTSNKIAADTVALVEDTPITAANVSVDAADHAEILATTTIDAVATIKNDYGASVVANWAKNLLGDYAFTTQSGTRTVHGGDLVYIDAAQGGLKEGAVYRYNGPDGASVDFSALDEADWSEYKATEIIDTLTGLFPSLAGGSATGAAGLIVLNEV